MSTAKWGRPQLRASCHLLPVLSSGHIIIGICITLQLSDQVGKDANGMALDYHHQGRGWFDHLRRIITCASEPEIPCSRWDYLLLGDLLHSPHP